MKKTIRFLYGFILLCSLTWALGFIWVYQWGGFGFTLFISFMAVSTILSLYLLYHKKSALHKYGHYSYWFFFFILVVIFFCMKPSNDHVWDAEVEKIISFRFVDGQVEIDNIRNFIWSSPNKYVTKWETRRYKLEDLENVDVVVSHFLAGPVAHAFITFGFKGGEQLAFSLEVRKEKGEDFSTIGGFFRQYELALVIGDESDVIYTRSNIRNEDVYIYPIKMQKNEMQMLFLEFLNKANRLNNQPIWYNTLISNCSTILFDLFEHATGSLPRDYRIVLPGLLPNFLYDHELLDQRYSVKEWKKMAHINPKTKDLKKGPDDSDLSFSKLIRRDLPKNEKVQH